jgi:hypothetical protein
LTIKIFPSNGIVYYIDDSTNGSISIKQGRWSFDDFNYKNLLGGWLNFSLGYKNTELGNFDIPDGAVVHEEEDHGDDDHDEHEEEALSYVENSDFASEARQFGVSRTAEWGYFGVGYESLESLYGIPFHGDEHEDEHG